MGIQKKISGIARKVAIAIVVVFVALQLVPYGHSHTNPPVTEEPSWNNPTTKALFARACQDCHSNRTRWPWYSYIAPASWLIQDDVEDARSKFNVSEWGREKQEGDEAAGELREGDMPLPDYLRFHPEARLSESEKQQLLDGLIATFGEKKRDRWRDEHEEQ